NMGRCVVLGLPPEPLFGAGLPTPPLRPTEGLRSPPGTQDAPLEELNLADRYTMSDDEWDEKVRQRIARWKRLSAEKENPLYDMPPWLAQRWGLTPTEPGAAAAAAQ